MTKFVVVYDKTTDFTALETNLINAGCSILDHLSFLNVLVLECSDDSFETVPGVLTVEADTAVVAQPALEWHQFRVASKTLPAKSTFTAKNKGAGVNIYLIDSGVDVSHPEFQQANVVNLYSHNDVFDDVDGHGTAIASVIVGKTLGIATDATLKVVKIPMNETVQLSSLLTAFNVVSQDKDYEEFAVVNCSWTIPKSNLLDMLSENLMAKGIIIVAAAGNTISSADDLSPVGYNAVIGVGASDAFDRVISWAEGVGSNWGEEVDLFAPGIDVVVATKNGVTTETSGTSISAGIVSGIVAQYIHDIPNILLATKKEHISSKELQTFVINSCVEDVLFRNETIYGDTPNRLIMALISSKYYKNDISMLNYITPGETMEMHFDIDPDIVGSISIDKIALAKTTFDHPEWVVLNPTTNIIRVSPPIDVDYTGYEMFVEFLDNNEQRLGVSRFRFKFTDPNEEPVVGEIYRWQINEDDEVFVKAASGCYAGNCFSPNISCYALSSKYTTCVCYAGYSATCFSQF